MDTSPERPTPQSRDRLPMVALLAANGISGIGNSLSYIAIPWFVLITTGSAARTGLTAVASTVPLIATGVFGGALADRLGARRMSVVSDIASSLAVAAVPLLYHTVGLAFWELLALVFLGAVLDTPGYAARLSLFPDLIERAQASPERSNAALQVVTRVSQVFGPPLAGVLIAIMGASNVLWLDGVSFLISAGIVATLVPAATQATHEERAGGFLETIGAGFTFIRGDRVLLATLLTSACGAVLAEPIYSVVLPVYAREVYGSAVDLGLLYSALGFGSILGNLIFAAFGSRLPRYATFLVGYSVRAASFWVLIGLPSLPLLALLIVINATALEPCNPLFMTILQERIPPALRGRVFGAYMSLGAGAMPLGLLAYGVLLDQIGLRPTLMVLAGVNVLVPLSILLLPAWRAVGERRPVSELDAVAA